MKYGLLFRVAAVAAATTVIAGCGGADPEPEAGQPAAPVPKLAVVATTPEIADFVRTIGGDAVSVTQIIKPNVDPHDYEPNPADMQAIATAKVLVKNGVGLEEWLDRTIESAGYTGPVVDSSTGVTLREGGHHHEDEHGHEEDEHGHEEEEEKHAEGEEEHDPHIWHDPRNAKIMVENIQKGLAAADPAQAGVFSTNLTAYAAELDKLDSENAAAWEKIAKADRKLVTDHDALGYYIQRYDLEFVGSVFSTAGNNAELSAKQVTDLVAKIKATGAKAVFAQSSLPPETAELIARQAGVKVVAGEDALYGDSLGGPGTPGETYLGAERHNTKTIVDALAG
ncbi:metal ABC transporter substrate-binding protein [Actinoplanes sp. G11-F43]|uniref:metal ABC transporter substrate-binding protein n=1 Tax=Actinoplanes sp. G11-F43 TaxID=3424130 RepID=UPI003D33618C